MDRFFIVRHGNTFEAGEPARRIGARTDMALTAAGCAQAETLGRWFGETGVGFDRVYCGPLLRSRETARLITAALPDAPAPVPTPWLDEIDHGPDEDRSEAEVVARIGREALDRWDHEAVAPPGWSVDRDGRIAAWHALFAEEGPGEALLVTSNGAARFALIALGTTTPQSLKLRTGALGIIRRDAAGTLRLAAWDVRPGQRD